jgi:flagellar basal-body rod protein FlgF
MDNAQLITLSRQLGLQRQMDVVANNLANINTNGFKSENIMFEDYLMPKAEDGAFPQADKDLHFTEDWSTRHDMSIGSIEQTGGPLDVAIGGNGFLSVQTSAGERYSRDGAMTIDSTGTLVDVSGNPVLSTSGPVHFDSADTDISISPDGTISSSQGSKGKLKLTAFADPQALTHEGTNYYSGTGGSPDTTSRISQGSLERSNVSGVSEMVNMIRVQRAYQTIANMMEQQDQLRQTAVQQLGSTTA